MLIREDTSELFSLFRAILDQIKVDQKYKPKESSEDSENKSPNNNGDKDEQAWNKKEIRDKSLLKQSMYALIGNLCIEKDLRLKFASDVQLILTQVVTDFKQDLKDRKFDWLDMATKQLAIFINISVEEQGQKSLMTLNVFEELQELVKHCKSGEKLEREILERVFNLLSKMLRHPEAAPIVLKQKHTVFKAILYFNNQFAGELQMNSLRTLHPLMKQPNFQQVCFEEHKFTKSTFDAFATEV